MTTRARVPSPTATATATEHEADAPRAATRGARPRDPAAHELTTSIAGRTWRVSRALQVSQPGDAHEREAERVAARIAAGGSARVAATPAQPAVQRACACGGKDDDECHCSGVDRQAEAGQSSTSVPADVAASIAARQGGGASLPDPVREQMEPAFGTTFDDVRVHTGPAAHVLARRLSARAFTVGSTVWFGPGQWRPASAEGQRLIAHELTHVVQHRAAPERHGHRSVDRDPDPPTGERDVGTPTPSPGPAGPAAAPPAAAGATAGAAAGAAGSATPVPTPCEQMAEQLKRESASWLDTAITDLGTYLVDAAMSEVFGDAPTATMTRVEPYLMTAFRTLNPSYVRLIRDRLRLMRRLVGDGTVTVVCAPGHGRCSAGTVAFVERLHEVTMCLVGTPASGTIETFVHELAHATVPQVGVLTAPTSNATTVTDRAYIHDRRWPLLTTEEALDNAESYGVLVNLLRNGGSLLRHPPTDTAPGCASATDVLEVLVRVDETNQAVMNFLEGVYWCLGDGASDVRCGPQPTSGPATLANRHSVYRAPIVGRFPQASTAADVQAIAAIYAAMDDRYLRSGRSITCAAAGQAAAGQTAAGQAAAGQAVAGALVITRRGTVTASGVTLGATGVPTLTVTSDWLAASRDARVRALYAGAILDMGDWMYPGGFQVSTAMTYVDLAMDLAPGELPPPVAHSYADHLDADLDELDRRRERQRASQPATP